MLRHPSLIAVALASLAPAGSSAQDPLEGTWQGLLDAGAAKLRVVFHVTVDGDAYAATMDSPDQGVAGITVSEVRVDGTSVQFVVPAVSGGFEGTLQEDADVLEGTWSQGAASLPLRLERVDEVDRPNRPQEPEPPFPYASEDVRFASEDGIELAGTLTLPEGDGPFPGVVLVSGSGPQNRDEELLGHKPFLVLADHLTREGIAVLRYDERGVGESGGSFRGATTEDFTADALAALRFLRARDDVHDDGVGILGHSEGGLVGPLAATRSDDVAFVVLLAGPGLPGADILVEQSSLIQRVSGAREETVEANRATQRRLVDVILAEPDSAAALEAAMEVLREAREALPPAQREAQTDEALAQAASGLNTAWFRFFLAHDPAPVLERVDVPVLALLGELDLQVPAEANAEAIEAALARGGNPDHTVEVLPGLNHLFQSAQTGLPTEYGQIEETMSPVALERVSAWILERAGSSPE